MKLFLACFLLITSCCAFADTAKNLYTFPTIAQEKQFDILTHQLRCLVCQNETLADSNASLAKDLRQEVAQMILEGKNNSSIIHYLVNRYGDFVLYEPPFKSNTVILWILPFMLLTIGLSIAIMIIYQRQKIASRKR